MRPLRILALGDNHGDTESLHRIVEDTADEEFDYIVHTGDVTNTYKTDLQTGVEQLQSVEPYFETLNDRADLIYIYGNRDKERGPGSERRHVTDEYELSPGHRLHRGESIEVAGQRFTSNPEAATSTDILLTHGIIPQQFYQPDTWAYFCGDTHRAVQQPSALNTGYLNNDKGYLGAYFVVELDESGMTVHVRGLDEPWKDIICPDHEWYGRQFHPSKFGCRICKFGAQQQLGPMVHHAFNAAVGGEDEDPSATIDEIVANARRLFVDSDEYAAQVRKYLQALAENEKPSPFDPLIPAGESGTRLQTP